MSPGSPSQSWGGQGLSPTHHTGGPSCPSTPGARESGACVPVLPPSWGCSSLAWVGAAGPPLSSHCPHPGGLQVLWGLCLRLGPHHGRAVPRPGMVLTLSVPLPTLRTTQARPVDSTEVAGVAPPPPPPHTHTRGHFPQPQKSQKLLIANMEDASRRKGGRHNCRTPGLLGPAPHASSGTSGLPSLPLSSLRGPGATTKHKVPFPYFWFQCRPLRDQVPAPRAILPGLLG